jgi:hypothetical protein
MTRRSTHIRARPREDGGSARWIALSHVVAVEPLPSGKARQTVAGERGTALYADPVELPIEVRP